MKKPDLTVIERSNQNSRMARLQMNKKSQHHQQQNPKDQGWKFTFLGGTAQKQSTQKSAARFATESTDNKLTTQAVFPLSTTQVGNLVVIQQIQSGKNMLHRLSNMGLTLGAKVRVISKTASGSIIVSLQDRQIGLGADMANQVMATFAPGNN